MLEPTKTKTNNYDEELAELTGWKVPGTHTRTAIEGQFGSPSQLGQRYHTKTFSLRWWGFEAWSPPRSSTRGVRFDWKVPETDDDLET